MKTKYLQLGIPGGQIPGKFSIFGQFSWLSGVKTGKFSVSPKNLSRLVLKGLPVQTEEHDNNSYKSCFSFFTRAFHANSKGECVWMWSSLHRDWFIRVIHGFLHGDDALKKKNITSRTRQRKEEKFNWLQVTVGNYPKTNWTKIQERNFNNLWNYFFDQF